MAWVRLHDGAMTHPKIIKLSDKAFRLWVWGLSYCQLHLTDGLVPVLALPPRLKRASDDLVRCNLWHLVEAFGYIVHDYLDWNDSKELIIKKRSEAKGRMQGNRDRSRELLSRTPLTEVLRGVGLGSSSGLEKNEDDVGNRAAVFLDRYQALYREHRNGAQTLIKPALDWTRCCDLCRQWDSPRLEKLAAVFLKTDDEWIARTDRGFGVFVAKVSWCDDRLRAWETTHGVAV